MLTFRRYQLRIAIILIILVVFITVPITTKSTKHPNSNHSPLATHNFWLSPLTYEAYSFECERADVLEGSFTVTVDGDHFIYDQKKYDLWVGWGDGVDLYIFDEQSFHDWSEGKAVEALFNKNDLTDFSWRISLPDAGIWYVVYDNDSSIYGKQVEGIISHFSQSSIVILGLFAVAVTIAVLMLGFAFRGRHS